MSYSLLYSLPQALRYSNVPVFVEAGNLLRETETGRMAAQLRLKNGTGVPVTGAIVGITLLGAGGERLGGFSHSYSAYAAPGAEFGQAEFIALRDCPAVAFTVEFLRVSFADGHVWTPSGQPVPIPAAPQQPERRGKRCVFPLIFTAAAVLLYFASLYVVYISHVGNRGFLTFLDLMIQPGPILPLLLLLLFSVLCFALTPKNKAACKPLGIICLVLGCLQVLFAVFYFAGTYLFQIPGWSFLPLRCSPGYAFLSYLYFLFFRRFALDIIISMLAHGCLIAANFITGAAFLKAAR